MEFRGLFPPMITPFRNGKVDDESIGRLVEACAPSLDGMVVAGSTGEGPSMTFAERTTTIEAFGRAMRGGSALSSAWRRPAWAASGS